MSAAVADLVRSLEGQPPEVVVALFERLLLTLGRQESLPSAVAEHLGKSLLPQGAATPPSFEELDAILKARLPPSVQVAWTRAFQDAAAGVAGAGGEALRLLAQRPNLMPVRSDAGSSLFDLLVRKR